MKPSPHLTWIQPWSKLLAGIAWAGIDLHLPEPEKGALKEEGIIPLPAPIPRNLPSFPMQAEFSRLLRSIPWEGSTLQIPQNRLKEVL